MSALDKDTGEILVHLLTESEARDLTRQIQGFAETTWKLLVKAHEGRAHLALGYGTWEEYVRAEFDLSRSRSYQLIDLGRVVAELDGVSTMVDTDTISEREARAAVPLLSNPSLMGEAFDAAEEKAKAEGRKRTAEDVEEAAEELKPKLEPVPDDPPKGWAARQQAQRAEDARIAAEKKALDKQRADFKKQIDKAKPLLALDVEEVAGLLRDTDTRTLRSTLRDLADWARDLNELLDPNGTLGRDQ